jgi:hypothetical protein
MAEALAVGEPESFGEEETGVGLEGDSDILSGDDVFGVGEAAGF